MGGAAPLASLTALSIGAEKKGLAIGFALTLAACADWPAPGPATVGPWPELVPLSSLDLSPAPDAASPEATAIRAEAAGLSARAARLRGRGGVTGRGAALSARAAILRGPAGTEADREAMRARLARL